MLVLIHSVQIFR